VGTNRDPGCLSETECLKIMVREQGTTTAIELHGEWDLAVLRSIRWAISGVLDDVPECIVLDLSQLGFIDSSGLHATLELAEHAAAQNTQLVIIPGPRSVQRMFQITGLADRLPFVDKRPNGSTDARPHTARGNAAGSGAFSPPASGAGRPHEAAGAAPSSAPAPRHSRHAPLAKPRRRAGAGSRP
jgi:anti-sigma B factor antagonist